MKQDAADNRIRVVWGPECRPVPIVATELAQCAGAGIKTYEFAGRGRPGLE